MLIISVSAPRAGSSWYYELQNALLQADNQRDSHDVRAQYGWIVGPQPEHLQHWNVSTLYGHKLVRLAGISLLAGTFAVKSHEKPTRGLRILTRLGLAKSTYIYRDPRDRLVSIMKIAKKQRERGITNRSFGMVTGFDDALNWVETSLQHYRMWETHDGCLLVRYEDLVLDTLREMLRTRDFLELDVDDNRVQTIVDTLRENTDDSQLHFVSGRIGGYRSFLTPEQQDIANHRLHDQLIALGYKVD